MNKKILLFGKNGQLARELTRSLSLLGSVKVAGSKECPFEKVEVPIKIIREYRPDFIVNAAAFTNSEKAELEESSAMQMNGYTVGAIAEEAKKQNISWVHYSTDYVFDGIKTTPLTEKDVANPLSIYGKSKLLGEKLVQEVGGKHLIFRVSWIYGNHGTNFFKTMLRLGAEREEIRVVDDQIGGPTWSRNIAEATSLVLSQKDISDKSGLYHMSSQGSVSWYQFADSILQKAKNTYGLQLKVEKITPIKSHEYSSRVRRPAFSVMSNELFASTFGFQLPYWEESLSRVIEDEFVG